MLLGKLPSKTGVFSNAGAIPESSATFLHSLVAAGYGTTLIGRMHFIGTNQRHGFTARLVGDMTPVTWNRPLEALARARGVFRTSYAEPGSLEVIGGGDSPVLRYDKDVIQAALEFLSKKHEKPQCILIGTYGPHFPYVAPPELFRKYRAAASWKRRKKRRWLPKRRTSA
jgi:choline-sulfatase